MTMPKNENIPALNQSSPQRFLSARIHILVYLFLSVLFCSSVFNWTNLGSHSIQGIDPSLNAWVLQRVTHNLLTDPLHPLDGNVYHPSRNSLTAWDHMTSLAVFNIPFQLMTKNPWVGYNLLIFLAYFISALGGYRLAFTLTGNRHCAFWAGLFWGFLFFRIHHFSHLQILSFQWMPFAVESLISWVKTEKNSHLFRLTLFTLLQSLVGWYLAVIKRIPAAYGFPVFSREKELKQIFPGEGFNRGFSFFDRHAPFHPCLQRAYHNIQRGRSIFTNRPIRRADSSLGLISIPRLLLCQAGFSKILRYSIWG